MLSQEIMSVHAVMGCLLPRVDPESAELVRLCRRNLEASADTAETLERTLIAPKESAPAVAASCLVDRPPLRCETTGGGL